MNMSTDELMTSLMSRGCTVQVSPSGMVRVKGGRVSVDEIKTLQVNVSAVAKFLTQGTVSHTTQVSGLELTEQVDKWKAACTPARCYDWSTRNWMTQKYNKQLIAEMILFDEGASDTSKVHKAFVKWADAHKRNTTVVWMGRKRQT